MVLGGENRIFASIPRPRKRLIELMRVMVLAAAMYLLDWPWAELAVFLMLPPD